MRYRPAGPAYGGWIMHEPGPGVKRSRGPRGFKAFEIARSSRARGWPRSLMNPRDVADQRQGQRRLQQEEEVNTRGDGEERRKSVMSEDQQTGCGVGVKDKAAPVDEATLEQQVANDSQGSHREPEGIDPLGIEPRRFWVEMKVTDVIGIMKDRGNDVCNQEPKEHLPATWVGMVGGHVSFHTPGHSLRTVWRSEGQTPQKRIWIWTSCGPGSRRSKLQGASGVVAE